MAIAEDSSAPPIVRSATGTTLTTASTASFTPPAGSLLLAAGQVSLKAQWVTVPTTITITNSGTALTWNQIVYQLGTTDKFAYMGIWYAVVGTSAAMTVTMTRSEAQAGDLMLGVRVLTGAASSLTGAASASVYSATDVGNVSITPTKVGSMLYVQATDFANSHTLTVVAGTTTLDSWADSTNASTVAFGKAGPTASTSATSVGWTTGGNSPGTLVQAAEVTPAVQSAVKLRTVQRVASFRSTNF